jgi:hypothetical protein
MSELLRQGLQIIKLAHAEQLVIMKLPTIIVQRYGKFVDGNAFLCGSDQQRVDHLIAFDEG